MLHPYHWRAVLPHHLEELERGSQPRPEASRSWALRDLPPTPVPTPGPSPGGWRRKEGGRTQTLVSCNSTYRPYGTSHRTPLGLPFPHL